MTRKRTRERGKGKRWKGRERAKGVEEGGGKQNLPEEKRKASRTRKEIPGSDWQGGKGRGSEGARERGGRGRS